MYKKTGSLSIFVNTQCILCLMLALITNSTIGQGNYKKQPSIYFEDKFVSKQGTMQLLSTRQLDETFSFPVLYEDNQSGEMYILQASNFIAIEDIPIAGKPTQKLKVKQTPELQVVQAPLQESGLKTVGDDRYIEFVSQNYQLPSITLELPQHHTAGPKYQRLRTNRPGFNTNEVLKKLNTLGLRRMQRVSVKDGGFNIMYDRLFINDEDDSKMLVIWLDNDRLYANFLSNSGVWLFPEPKIIHNEMACIDATGNSYSRNLQSATDKSTLVTELNSIKSGNDYYIGYSISTWEAHTCFGENLASCHLLLLSDQLEVKQSDRIPAAFQSNYENLFTQDLQMQIVKNEANICVVVQSPNVGKDNLYAVVYNKNFRQLSSLKYLSNSSNTYGNLIPVIADKAGFMLTYKEKEKTHTSIYTQYISNEGRPFAPVLLFSLPDTGETYISAIHVKQNPINQLTYYIIVKNRATKKGLLFEYGISVEEYIKARDYQVNEINWKNDQQVKWIDSLALSIDESIKKKKLVSFTKGLTEFISKQIFVDQSFLIQKYQEKQSKEREFNLVKTFYYDGLRTLRLAKIELSFPPDIKNPRMKPGTFWVYYNQSGKKIWEIKVGVDGKAETRGSNNNFFDLEKVSKPYDDFHLKRN